MKNDRPRSREKHVTGSGKTVEKRGKGLGTGPVGDAGGYAERGQQGQSAGTRSTGTRAAGAASLPCWAVSRGRRPASSRARAAASTGRRCWAA